jgi:hypothetical protein
VPSLIAAMFLGRRGKSRGSSLPRSEQRSAHCVNCRDSEYGHHECPATRRTHNLALSGMGEDLLRSPAHGHQPPCRPRFGFSGAVPTRIKRGVLKLPGDQYAIWAHTPARCLFFPKWPFRARFSAEEIPILVLPAGARSRRSSPPLRGPRVGVGQMVITAAAGAVVTPRGLPFRLLRRSSSHLLAEPL